MQTIIAYLLLPFQVVWLWGNMARDAVVDPLPEDVSRSKHMWDMLLTAVAITVAAPALLAISLSRQKQANQE